MRLWMVLLVAVVLALAVADTGEAAGLRLNWSDNSSNEANFHIDRKAGPATGPAPWSLNIATVGAGIVTFHDAAAPEGQEMCYRVTASNPAGTSDPTNTACAVAPWTRPLPPSGLAVTPVP